MMYFEGLVKSALKERMSTAEPGHDFVQTMADSVNEVKRSDPDALKDKDGLVWSKKGTCNTVITIVETSDTIITNEAYCNCSECLNSIIPGSLLCKLPDYTYSCLSACTLIVICS